MTASGVLPSNRGPVIVILYQYAHLAKGSSIHSCIQLESYKNTVDDKAISHGGTQTIQTIDGYIHIFDFVNGLPYISLRPYTDKEWEELPHVIWTSNTDWNPSSIDQSLTNDPKWAEKTPSQPDDNNRESLMNEGNSSR